MPMIEVRGDVAGEGGAGLQREALGIADRGLGGR